MVLGSRRFRIGVVRIEEYLDVLGFVIRSIEEICFGVGVLTMKPKVAS